jgi:nitrogen fixation/metabolism regulation signal transduction histidine kinase
MLVVALVISGTLGTMLWGTSRAVIAQSQEAVRQGEAVVEVGRVVVAESQKVAAVVQMNLVKDPVYKDNPDLLAVFQADSREQDRRLAEQQGRLEQQTADLRRQAQIIVDQQNRLRTTLYVGLGLLVVALALAGIVVTHRVAGPIYKMRRLLREVADGKLRVPGRLRKGDELVEFFETFDIMVRNLRERQAAEIERLDEGISHLERVVAPEELERLRSLRTEMKAALD